MQLENRICSEADFHKLGLVTEIWAWNTLIPPREELMVTMLGNCLEAAGQAVYLVSQIWGCVLPEWRCDGLGSRMRHSI